MFKKVAIQVYVYSFTLYIVVSVSAKHVVQISKFLANSVSANYKMSTTVLSTET